jgi:hypothetical protein
MRITSLSHDRQFFISVTSRRTHGSARRRATCCTMLAALGLFAGFATSDARAALFGSPSSIALPQHVVAMATGDVNHDGKLDLIAASNRMASGQSRVGVYVMLGKKSGGFGTPSFYGLVDAFDPILAVAVADINGDGETDIVTANEFGRDGSFGTSAIINVLLNDGKGNFFPANQQTYVWPGFYRATPTSVAVSDVNGDGKPEVIVGNSGSVYVWWLGEQYTTTSFGGWPAMLAVGDVNGDGRPDIVATSAAQVDVLLKLGGNNGFAAAQPYAVGGNASSAALGDVNGDGKLDILAANAGNGCVNALPGNGDGTFGAAQSYAVAGTPNSIALGDFNADCKPDIVTSGTAQVDVLLNNGDGTFGAAQAVGPAESSVVVADFNSDGLPDFAQIDGSGTSIDVILNTSTPSKVHK